MGGAHVDGLLANFIILIIFSYIARILMYPVNIVEMAAQLVFPMLFFGNLAFMFSTITRSGNGTAVLMIIIGLFLFVFLNASSGGGGPGGPGMPSNANSSASIGNSFWNVFINPFTIPTNIHPMIWQDTILKNRLFLLLGGVVFLMIGLLNLQKREKFM